MKKIKKPIKKSEIAQFIEQGWLERRAAWKIRNEKNSQRTKDWKLRESSEAREKDSKK